MTPAAPWPLIVPALLMMLTPEENVFVPANSQSAPTLLLMIAFDKLTPPTIEELLFIVTLPPVSRMARPAAEFWLASTFPKLFMTARPVGSSTIEIAGIEELPELSITPALELLMEIAAAPVSCARIPAVAPLTVDELLICTLPPSCPTAAIPYRPPEITAPDSAMIVISPIP